MSKIRNIIIAKKRFKKLKIDIENNHKKILSGVNDKRLANNPIKIKKTKLIHILKNF